MEYQIKDMDSKSELKEVLSKISEPKLLIECLDVSPNQYKLMKLGPLNVGLIDHSFGIPVQIESLNNQTIFLIGHESEIDCVSIETANLLWKVKLDSVFFQFKKVPTENCIVVIEEAGVHSLDFSGNKLWSFATDVITDYQISNSSVDIKTIDDLGISISIQSGKVILPRD